MFDAVRKEKLRKADGFDGTAIEAIMYDGLRPTVRICFLFNVFIKFGYLYLRLLCSL